MANLNPSPPLEFLPGTLEASVHFGADVRAAIRETMWTDKGMEVSIDFLVAWKDRIKFLYLLRGSCGFDGADYWRRLPISLPTIDFDTLDGLGTQEDDQLYQWGRYFCSSIGELRPIKPRVTDDGFDPTGVVGWPFYEDVVVPTKWSVPLYYIGDAPIDPGSPGRDPSGMPYTTTRWRSTGEIFSPYTNAYRFKGEATPANEANIGILRLKKELSITRHFMPLVDTASLDPLFGKINLDAIKIGTDTYPPESLMYLGYEPEPYINPANGRIVYDITHKIIANGEVFDKAGAVQRSWNYYMNRSGYWDKLVLKDNAAQGVYHMDEFACKIWPEYVKCAG
jgi:hypothetical protein